MVLDGVSGVFGEHSLLSLNSDYYHLMVLDSVDTMVYLTQPVTIPLAVGEDSPE